MSIENITTKYFKILVSWVEPPDEGGFVCNRVLLLPCVCYSTQEKLVNYLNRAGIGVLTCEELIS